MSFCPQCGKETLPGASFCVVCGASLPAGPPPSQAIQTETTIERSTPLRVAPEAIGFAEAVAEPETSSKNSSAEKHQPEGVVLATQSPSEAQTPNPATSSNNDKGAKINSNKSKKNYWIIIPAFILLSLLMRYIGGQTGKIAAVQDIQSSVPSTGFPVNLFGTRWAMSKSEFISIIHDSKEITPTKLMITRKFYDRNTLVSFDFQDDMLMIIVITFLGPSTLDNYNETQARLQNDYGNMSTVGSNKDFELYSTKKVDRYVMNHGFRVMNNNPTEQLIIYRGKIDNTSQINTIEESKTSSIATDIFNTTQYWKELQFRAPGKIQVEELTFSPTEMEFINSRYDSLDIGKIVSGDMHIMFQRMVFKRNLKPDLNAAIKGITSSLQYKDLKTHISQFVTETGLPCKRVTCRATANEQGQQEEIISESLVFKSKQIIYNITCVFPSKSKSNRLVTEKLLGSIAYTIDAVNDPLAVAQKLSGATYLYTYKDNQGRLQITDTPMSPKSEQGLILQQISVAKRRVPTPS